MQMERGKHYFAFISHSSKDEQTALWLRDKLDHYHIPTAVQKAYGVPSTLKPNFTFQTDLAGNKLAETLNTHLDDSRFLIVVCSPDAAKSQYVNGEVQHFVDTGRTGNIIPFIVEGTPHASSPEEECFPPALLALHGQNELRGISLKESEKHLGSKMAAVVNVIATMLGIRFDVLWDKYRHRRMRRRAAVAAVALLVVLLGLFLWDYHRPTYRYFADYVDCFGVPEGVVEISKEQVQHCYRLYQFEYRRIPFGEPGAYSWRLANVSFVNSALRPQSIVNSVYKDRTPILELEYNKGTGIIQRVNYCDENGKVLLRHELSERNGVTAAIADFHHAQEQKGSGFVGASLTSQTMGQMDENQTKSNIVRYAYERDAKGHVVKITYHSNNDSNLSRSAVCDGDGVFGCLYTLDSLGRRVKVEFLGLEDKKVCTRTGLAGYAVDYDDHGSVLEATYFDLLGEPSFNEGGFTRAVNVSDEWGNCLEEALYGPDGALCLNRSGFARVTFTHDERGNVVETAYYGTDGEPCFVNGFAKMTATYDKHGNKLEECYFGTDGEPCYSNEHVARMQYEFDKYGHIIHECCYGTDGKPCLSVLGVAESKLKYDEKGNVVEVCVYGTDGKPCFANSGNAKTTISYNDAGLRTEAAYFGPDGKPCLNYQFIAKWTATYDERGNMTETARFGTDGKPCLDNYGVHKIVTRYNENGNVIEKLYYGTDGKLCLSNDGFAGFRADYDAHGNQTELVYFGTETEPSVYQNGCTRLIAQFDERGNNIEGATFGDDGAPHLSDLQVARWTTVFDDRGNPTEMAYFGTDGKPCLSSDGIARWEAKYDERGNNTEMAYFGIDGKPIATINGAKTTFLYDSHGRMVEVACFGTDGKPCLSHEQVAKSQFLYDKEGRRIETKFFGTDGNLCNSALGYARWTCVYDERGHVVETADFDADGKLCLSKDGFAIKRSRYDDKGFCIENLYLGPDSLPIAPMGYYREERTLNERGETVATTYYDVNNRLLGDYYFAMQVVSVSGYAFSQGVPQGSVILQLNDWVIGEGQEKAYQQRQKKFDMHYYLLTPEGKIIHLHKDAGKLGLACYDIVVGKAQADEFRAMLERWKQNN